MPAKLISGGSIPVNNGVRKKSSRVTAYFTLAGGAIRNTGGDYIPRTNRLIPHWMMLLRKKYHNRSILLIRLASINLEKKISNISMTETVILWCCFAIDKLIIPQQSFKSVVSMKRQQKTRYLALLNLSRVTGCVNVLWRLNSHGSLAPGCVRTSTWCGQFKVLLWTGNVSGTHQQRAKMEIKRNVIYLCRQ